MKMKIFLLSALSATAFIGTSPSVSAQTYGGVTLSFGSEPGYDSYNGDPEDYRESNVYQYNPDYPGYVYSYDAPTPRYDYDYDRALRQHQEDLERWNRERRREYAHHEHEEHSDWDHERHEHEHDDDNGD